MALELLELLSLAGGGLNEDAFGHNAGAAVVMDGATPLGDSIMPGRSDAAWIAQFGARRLLAHLREGEGPRKALRGALADAEKSFNALRLRDPADVWQTPAASMMLAAETDEGVEFLWFGDCAALVMQGDAVMVVGETFDRKASESESARQAAQNNGQPSTRREHHLDGLRARRNRINSGAYWLFTPAEKAAAHVARRVVKLPPGAVILLASDGFLALATDYGAYNPDSLMQTAMARGLDVLGEELRAIEDADAQGVKFPRFKTSDDATALLLRLT
jgi:serine/threonine protein phosphatase PrpC